MFVSKEEIQARADVKARAYQIEWYNNELLKGEPGPDVTGKWVHRDLGECPKIDTKVDEIRMGIIYLEEARDRPLGPHVCDGKNPHLIDEKHIYVIKGLLENYLELVKSGETDEK